MHKVIWLKCSTKIRSMHEMPWVLDLVSIFHNRSSLQKIILPRTTVGMKPTILWLSPLCSTRCTRFSALKQFHQVLHQRPSSERCCDIFGLSTSVFLFMFCISVPLQSDADLKSRITLMISLLCSDLSQNCYPSFSTWWSVRFIQIYFIETIQKFWSWFTAQWSVRFGLI